MTAAVRALINGFMIPYINVHLLTGSYFEHNSASRKVFERNGFVLWKIVKDAFELQECKTGVQGKKIRGAFMRWTRSPRFCSSGSRVVGFVFDGSEESVEEMTPEVWFILFERKPFDIMLKIAVTNFMGCLPGKQARKTRVTP